MKKLAKILIVVMSLALIVGALAVVISAEDTPAQPEKVEYTVNGEVVATENGTFDEAIAAVAANTTAGANINIKLLGDCTSAGINLTAVAEAGKSAVTIDLNGYTLDMSSAATAFYSGSYVSITVTGTGNLKFGTQLFRAKAADVFKIVGSDANNRIQVFSTSETNNVFNLASFDATNVYLKNVDLSVAFSREVTPQRSNLSGALIDLNAQARFKMESCSFKFDVAFTVNPSVYDVDLTANQAADKIKCQGMSGLYFLRVAHQCQAIFVDCDIKTAGSGIQMAYAKSGSNYRPANGVAYGELGTDKYLVGMIDSRLVCLNDNATTLQTLKDLGEFINPNKAPFTASDINRNVLFNSNMGGVTHATTNVYIKNSYTSGNYRMIYGDSTNSTSNDSVKITYDNSTLEWRDNSFTIGGTKGGNGDGMFSVGGTYMNFINGSILNLNGIGLTCAGSENSNIGNNIKGTLQGAIANGQYVLDLCEGTRLPGTLGNVDLPAGAKFIYDPKGNSQFPYLVTTNYSNITWYYGSSEALSSQTVEVINGTKNPVDTGALNIGGVIVNGGVFGGIGWIANEWINPADFENGDAYMAAVEGKEVFDDFSDYIVNETVVFYPVYNYAGVLGFSVTASSGAVSYYTVDDDLNAAMATGLSGATVKLYADYTITDKYRSYKDGDTSNASKDEYLRNVRYFDLNGNTLYFNMPSGNWLNFCRGTFKIYSSVPGGKMVDIRDNVGFPVFDVYGGGANLSIGTVTAGGVEYSGANMTVQGYRLAHLAGPHGSDKTTTKVEIKDTVVINTAGAKANWIFTHSDKTPSGNFIAENTVFINAVANSNIIKATGAKGTSTFNNCTVISLADNCGFVDGIVEGATVTVNGGSYDVALIANGGNAILQGNVKAAAFSGNWTTEDGKVIAYNPQKMAMPSALGESYAVGETTITAETLATLNYCIADVANTETHTWNNPDGEAVASVVAVKGVNVDSFVAQASNALKDYKKNLNVLYLVHDGNWTTDGTTYTATVKVGGVVKGAFLASVGMTVHKNFDINFMVDANSYGYLDDATKALFTQVGEYYIVTESVARAVNQAFTKAEYDLVIVDGEYTHTAHYEASIVDYVAKNFAEGSGATEKNKAMAYYIAAYLNSAYAYFNNTDEPSADALAALAAIVTAQSEHYATGLTPDVDAGDYSKLSGDGVEIAIDLKSTPKYVITSATYAGTVTFNGVTKSFAAGETVELSASVLNFDNELTITLQDADNSTGTYSLANYVENSKENDSYSAELKALVKAFSDYVIYAENFRAK